MRVEAGIGPAPAVMFFTVAIGCARSPQMPLRDGFKAVAKTILRDYRVIMAPFSWYHHPANLVSFCRL